jgi:hypothetical protein
MQKSSGSWQGWPAKEKRKLLENLKSRNAKLSKFSPALAWHDWLEFYFPSHIRHAFAERHEEFWTWVWGIEKGNRPPPLIAVWPRGGGKSTSAELSCSALGLREKRSYALYVSGTQSQADGHVGNIGNALENAGVQRAVNKYGASRGWRRNRLSTENKFTIDALGLDTAARGVKTDESRPDLIILDDLDELHDTDAAVEKKIETITQTILPAGSNDCAVMFVQNLVHANSVCARLVDGRADFLTDRIVSGPFKAIDNFEYETKDGYPVIKAGVATWEGQDLEACQNFIRTWGIISFLQEAQQDVKQERPGALWSRAQLDAPKVRLTAVNIQLFSTVLSVDPGTGSSKTSAEWGMVVVGAGLCSCKGFPEVHAFVLDDVSDQGLPEYCAGQGVTAYFRNRATKIIAEWNQGGEMIRATFKLIPNAPEICKVWASHSKEARAEPISVKTSQGMVHFVGHFPKLENELCTWVPSSGAPSPNRLDAMVHAITYLLVKAPPTKAKQY